MGISCAPMKRRWRIFDWVLPAVSTLLLTATIALWIRSYWISDIIVFGWKGADFQYEVLAGHQTGKVGIFVNIGSELPLQFMHFRPKSEGSMQWNPPTFLHRLGFEYFSDPAPAAYLASTTIGFPYWFATLVFISIPFDRLTRRRQCRVRTADRAAAPVKS